MRLLLIVSSLLALAACASNAPAPAATTAAAAPAASGVVVADEDKVVCHRVQDPGALVSHTKCEKQSEMDLRGQQALQDAATANQRSHMHAVPGSGG